MLDPSYPPSLPKNLRYTSCYCEENIYLLAQDFAADPLISSAWDILVVFISNHSKTVALWNQKLAREPGLPMVWDYHVILLLRPSSRRHNSDGTVPIGQNETIPDDISHTWAYDYDTCLSVPCTLEDYIRGTFGDVPTQFQSMFRVIPGNAYLDNFASDRSHMLLVNNTYAPEPQVAVDDFPRVYSSPPPLHDPLVGVSAAKMGILNNLMSSFVSMTSVDEGCGEVLDKISFMALC